MTNVSNDDKSRLYRLKLSAHKLKNRSSKSILKLCHWDRYNLYRHISKDELTEMANNGNFEAQFELNRRNKRAERRAANKGK